MKARGGDTRTVDQALWRRRSAVLVVLSLLLGLVGTVGGTPLLPAAAAGTLTDRWTFDAGSGTTAVNSQTTRPATLGAGAGWTAGFRGPFALSTNGTSTANAATARSIVTTTSSFTVSAYARANALGGPRTIASQDGNLASGFALQLRADGKFGFARAASDTASPTISSAVSTAAAVTGQWYHLAGVYDASAGTLSLYVNGGLQQTVSAPAAWNASGVFVMGRGRSNGAAAEFWNGAIDDVRVYDGPLTATEIQTTAVAAYWKLNEGSGTSTADAGEDGFPGTLTGGAGWTTGLFGSSAVNLDGVDDAVAATGPVLNTSRSYSVTAWVRPDEVKGSVSTVASIDGTQASPFALQNSSIGRWGFRATTSDTSNPGETLVGAGPPAATVGTWYHLAGVYDSAAGTLTLYVNGVRAGSSNFSSGWTSNGNFVLGRARVRGVATNYWPGGIEDVRAYPFAIDAAHVATLAEIAPPSPAAPTATVNGTSATVTWVAPSPIAGTPITGYVVTPYLNGIAQPAQNFSATTTSATFAGLAPGGSYRYSVAATNANGTSAPSAQSAPVTASAPGAPTITAASAAPSAVNLTWSAPTSNASGITGYRVTPYLGSTAQTPRTFGASSAGSAQAITGLTPGTSYTFRVAAQNAVGYGPDSAASAAITAGADRPATPSAPTATAGRTSATVSWVAPAANASAITGYVVTPYLSGTAQTARTFTSTATTQTITNLTANASYTFTVAATNSVGTSADSEASTAVTPYDVPGAPTITSVAAGTQSARITFTAPSANGSPVTGYRVTPFVGSQAQSPVLFSTSAGTTLTVPGLTAGTAYTFTLAAENIAGYGADSTRSGSATPNAAPALTFSDPPGAVVGQAYSQQLTVTDGTSPYTWSVTSGTLPPGLTLSSDGLLSGTATASGSYTFTVRVVDASGSAATRSVTLLVSDRPARPAAPTVTAGLGSAVVSWTAPASNGSVITDYIITPYLDGQAQASLTVDPSAKTRTLTGLTVGGRYTFTIAARNANGTSAASAASASVIPFAALSAPTITAVTPGTGSATLTWTAPTHTGGSPVTSYVVTPFVGGVAQPAQVFPSAATTQTVTGLTPGTAYTFRVAARNVSGTEVLHRVNAGGASLASVDGGLAWSDDSAATNPLRNAGSATSTAASPGAADGTVPITTPMALFTTERYDEGAAGDGGEMAWAFPVPAGAEVKARLYFTNQFTGTTTVGSRIFDVALEGSTVLPEFDIIAAAGGTQTGTMREFAVTSDGTVNIDFGHRVQNPLVNGFEIIRTRVAAEGPASVASASTTPNSAPTLSFPPPPAGEVAVAYSHQLTVENGTAPFTWSFTGGTLPPGVALSATGRLSGTPTAAGTFSFTVRATDASGSSATRAVTLTVVPPPAASFNPGVGEVGVAYSAQATVAGGTGPFTWSVATGSLPGGLALNSSTGLVTGTPTTAGDSAVTVRVVDVFDQAATSTATIAIAPRPTLTTSPPAAQAGVPYSFTFAATGGTSPFRYAVVAGALPGGLTLSDAGVLTGTVFTTGTSTFTVRAVGASGGSVDQAVTFRVEQPDVAVVKTANTTSTTAGSTVTYTLTATNNAASGTYDGVRIEDPLAGVLDDAVYNGDAVATRGALGYAAATLAWTLDLPAGTTATLTYSVTVAAPVTGDHLLDGTVVTTGASTNCNPGYADSRCSTTVRVAGLRVTTSADVVTTIPGDQVRLRFDAVNTGQTTYTDLAVELDPRGAADDATLTDPETSSGVVRPNPDGTATWTLTLAPGQRAVATTTATVKNPATGDRSLVSSATSGAPGSTCTAGNDSGCSVTVPVLLPQLTLSKVADRTETGPGEITTYTVTLRNTGETNYSAATVTDSLVGVVDDATYNADATATAGAVSYAAGTLTWTADLATGATATLTYSVTVGGASGDLSLRSAVSSTAPGSTCPPGSTASACTSTVSVRPPELELRGLTSAFTLVGPSGSTSVLDRAVEMTVRTNNPPGYLVTVRAPQEVLVGGPGNDDSIPTSRLAVRHSGPGPYTPLSQDPVVVHRASRATADVGELSSYDFKIDLPFVKPDTYSTTLEYIVTAL